MKNLAQAVQQNVILIVPSGHRAFSALSIPNNHLLIIAKRQIHSKHVILSGNILIFILCQFFHRERDGAIGFSLSVSMFCQMNFFHGEYAHIL